ncbi:MAG: hypothetical protein WAU58_01555 [Terriglobales bacterium]|jgi:hypothetical protein
MSNVTIEINSKWVKVVRSPVYWVVASLQGISISFAPLFLYWSGRGGYFPGLQAIVTPLCFAIIFGVQLFYFLLGAAVIKELRQR